MKISIFTKFIWMVGIYLHNYRMIFIQNYKIFDIFLLMRILYEFVIFHSFRLR